MESYEKLLTVFHFFIHTTRLKNSRYRLIYRNIAEIKELHNSKILNFFLLHENIQLKNRTILKASKRWSIISHLIYKRLLYDFA